MKLLTTLSTLILLLCCSGVKVPDFIERSMPEGRLLKYEYSESGTMRGTTEEYRVELVDGHLNILSKTSYNHQVYVEIADTTLLDSIRRVLVEYKAQKLDKSYVNSHVLDGYMWGYSAKFERQSKDDYDYTLSSGGSNKFPKTDMFNVIHRLIDKVAQENKPPMPEGRLVSFEYKSQDKETKEYSVNIKAEKKGKEVIVSQYNPDDKTTDTAKAGEEVLDSILHLLIRDDAQCFKKDYPADWESMHMEEWQLKAKFDSGHEIVSGGTEEWPAGDVFYKASALIKSFFNDNDK